MVPHVLVVAASEIGFETSKRRYELGPCHYGGLEIANGSHWCNDDLVEEGWRNQTGCDPFLVQIRIVSMTLISTSCMNVPCSYGQGIEKAIDLGQQPCAVFESEIEIVSRKSLCRTSSWRRNPSLNPLRLQEQAKRAWAYSEGVFASLL